MIEEGQRLSSATIADLLRLSMAQGQRPYLTITSGSMRPLFQIGDEVQLESAAAHELQPGDIITLAAPAALITHRFCAVQLTNDQGGRCLITRGDRFLNFDSPWAETLLVGRVVARRRQKRWVLPLTRGSGSWLGRHVAWLAAAENRFFNLDWRLAGQPALPDAQLTTSFASIQVRRLVYLWITLVAGLVSLVARLVPAKTQIRRANSTTNHKALSASEVTGTDKPRNLYGE